MFFVFHSTIFPALVNMFCNRPDNPDDYKDYKNPKANKNNRARCLEALTKPIHKICHNLPSFENLTSFSYKYNRQKNLEKLKNI